MAHNLSGVRQKIDGEKIFGSSGFAVNSHRPLTAGGGLDMKLVAVHVLSIIKVYGHT
jgi:hypothetical protein